MVGAAVDITLPVLYAVSMVVLVGFGVHLLVLAWRVRGEPMSVPGAPPPAGDACPRITVQVPLFNEALVAARSVDACAGLTWPRDRLQIQILDDSNDDTPAIVAERVQHWQSIGLDIHHVRRDNRDGYKAGALAHGLATATGDFIAILDADFVPAPDMLLRLMPSFDADDVGLVQARWGHLNAAGSTLTRVQALGLDVHFMVEQRVRDLTGCFINFNGTAGIWRRTAIESSGGWQSDTLTEDLDLSFRAQLAGWRLRFDPHTVVDAELPVSMNAFRAQQHRWTKGGLQSARKLLRAVWTAPISMRRRVEGTFHLLASAVFPFIALAALTHGPVVWLEAVGRGPGPVYFGVLWAGLAGFAGVIAAHVVAQRSLHADWIRRLAWLPAFLAGSIGMCVNNTRAAWEVLMGRATPFVRTPKFAVGSAWWTTRYASRDVPGIVGVELAFGLWSAGWFGVLLVHREWLALPFQFLFAAGFFFVALYNLIQARRT